MKPRSWLAFAGPLLLLACATPPGAAWRAAHPGAARRAPALGAELGEVLASLAEHESGSPRVAVARLEMLDLERDPWQPVESEAAFTRQAQGAARHAVVAQRTCRRGLGPWRQEATRASWLLFRGGRLAAFDHWEFAEDCAPEHRFRPAAAPERALETDLARHVARRFPGNALGPEETFRKGLVYLEHDRVDEASAMLALGDRALAERAREVDGEETGDEGGFAEARTARAELSMALRERSGLDQDPGTRFWEGY